MKISTITLYILLILVVGVGFVIYIQRARNSVAQSGPGPLVSTSSTPSSGFQVIPSPIPTVAQIPLTITAPLNGSSVTSPKLIIRGTTSPKADVFVNDAQVIANAQGNFTVQVTLDEGENTLVVTANDANGNYSEQDLTVTYNSGQ